MTRPQISLQHYCVAQGLSHLAKSNQAKQFVFNWMCIMWRLPHRDYNEVLQMNAADKSFL